MIKKNKNLILIIILTLIFFSIDIFAENSIIKIEIDNQVEINKSEILLGDIATISGGAGNNLAELRKLNLGKAVFPGFSSNISKEQIVLQIQNLGYSLNDFLLDMPDDVSVISASTIISSDRLAKEGKEFLSSKISSSSEEKVEIISNYRPKKIIIPENEYEIKYSVSGDNPVGNVTIQASVLVNGSIYRRVNLGYKVRISKMVYVAKRNIYRNERIKTGDFKKELRVIDSYRGSIISDMKDSLVSDGIVRYPISTGEILTSYYLEKPYIIGYGDEITAEIIMGSIRVNTTVKARQKGKKGEFIIVENSKSGHRFKAQIVNSHLVRIEK
ncbi:MAG: flagellar basal body P-ring formation chaperone FlgA [Bacillota bacterium]